MSKHHVTKQLYTLKFFGLKKKGVISWAKGIFYSAGKAAMEGSRRWDLVQGRKTLSCKLYGVAREVILFTEKIRRVTEAQTVPLPFWVRSHFTCSQLPWWYLPSLESALRSTGGEKHHCLAAVNFQTCSSYSSPVLWTCWMLPSHLPFSGYAAADWEAKSISHSLCKSIDENIKCIMLLKLAELVWINAKD